MDAKPKTTNQESISSIPSPGLSARVHIMIYYSELDQLHVVLFKKKT